MVKPHVITKLVVVALLAASNVALANEDVVIPWHSATISFGNASDKNLVRISSNDHDELTEFVVHWRGRDLVVPSSEFKSLPKVQLQSVQVFQGDFYGIPNMRNQPYLNVALRFGDDSFGEFPLAWFLFYDGKFQRITFIKKTSKTTSDYIDKNPGQEAVKAGTSTVIREAPSPKPK